MIDPKDQAKLKEESFNIFFEARKTMFEKWQKEHPKWRYPLVYDPSLNKWYWMNRQQRKARRWNPFPESQNNTEPA